MKPSKPVNFLADPGVSSSEHLRCALLEMTVMITWALTADNYNLSTLAVEKVKKCAITKNNAHFFL